MTTLKLDKKSKTTSIKASSDKFKKKMSFNTSPPNGNKIIESSNEKGKFVKKRGTIFLEDGELIYPEEKFFEQDLNYQFTSDPSKYLGEFKCQYYTMTRRYLKTIDTRKNLRIYYTKAVPNDNIKAQFLLIHGFGEHSSRYMELLDFLCINNYIVHMIDLSGFGHSGGPRGNSTMPEMHDDIERVLKIMEPNYPLFVFGHSMGGGLIASLLINNPNLKIAGAVCSAALFGAPNDRSFPWILRKIMKYSGKALDDVVVNCYINGSALSKNNYHIKKMIDDRLMNPFLSLKSAKSAIGMMDFVIPNADKFKHPLLVIHGKADIVTKCTDSIKFYNNAGSSDKTLKIIPHAYHEPIHDVESDVYKSAILDFLEERYQTAPNFGAFADSLVKGFKLDFKKELSLLVFMIMIIFFIKKIKLLTSIIPVRQMILSLFKSRII